MNWRKPLIYLLLYASGSKIPKCLKKIEKYENADTEQIKTWTETKLKNLLLHCFGKVPYYKKILSDCGLVDDNGRVRLENFSKLPLLTKDIIRSEAANLYSQDYNSRKPYENTSGGTTGEPVKFIQDKNYDEWNIATKLYFNRILGKEPGQPEIKFWGSDRDILQGTLTLKDRMINFLYNRKFFNSYRLGEKEINELIDLNNRTRPVAYWSYMESAMELGKYLAEKKEEFYPPRFVISTIGPLTEEVKNQIENGMKCKVYNQYGSREVGVIACQCRQQKGLHFFPWYNYVELLDENNQPLQAGEGKIVVTTLQNYSMPLLRYEIGDVAVAGGNDCPCGRKTYTLKKVLGRTLGYFKKSDGSLAHSHFVVQALFFRKWIKRFQIIQDEINHILIKIQLQENKKPASEEIEDIKSKTKILMGENCSVDFEFVDVDEIQRTQSGKFRYTICNLT